LSCSTLSKELITLYILSSACIPIRAFYIAVIFLQLVHT